MAVRETLEVDVLFVGGGPAGLVGAYHLGQLLKKEGSSSPASIALIEKADRIGAHTLSGAVMDPRGIRELFPDFPPADGPFGNRVQKDSFWFLHSGGKIPFPILPPPLCCVRRTIQAY